MAKSKLDKKISSLEPFFESIFVCNNKKLRPFIEVFIHEPENIAQQNLGTLLGVFEVNDISEDSSYIANYLISVIKKEYSSHPKRGSDESFEAALHKANLALSKLAEHGNIKWIGKLNALIAVIEKNNLYLSQSGASSAFLLRSRSLTDISSGLASDETNPHPLKTFINISSGRLESNDKLIITTNGIFNIFSLEEIKKSALRFSGEKFIQFLKTALGNELEKAAVLVVDIEEKYKIVQAAGNDKEHKVNAFSSTAFSRNTTSAGTSEKINNETDKSPAPVVIPAEDSKEKNGHIYIKGSESILPKNTWIADFFSITKEKLSLLGEKILTLIKKLFKFLIRKVRTISLPRPNFSVFRNKKSEPISTETIPAPEAPTIAVVKNNDTKKTEIVTLISESIANKVAAIFKNAVTAINSFFRKFFPNFPLIKNIIAKMDYQRRLYAALIVIAIGAVPFFALKFQNYIQQKNATVGTGMPVAIPLDQDRNVVRLDTLNNAYSGENILSIVNLNGKIFGIAQTQIVDLQSQEAFSLPGSFGKIKLASGMDDLNLIFLMNQENAVLAWSPTSKKFQNNTLLIPNNSKVTAIGTYLTYLYILDATNNQIYRYPRASSGFGDKTDWLKDNVNLSRATGMALNENIFVANGDNILKLFKGKKQDFNPESSATPITPNKIYAKNGSQNIYILDKQNSRIIKLDLSGNIASQYYNYQIADAEDFTINEMGNTVYIATSNSIKSFNIN